MTIRDIMFSYDDDYDNMVKDIMALTDKNEHILMKEFLFEFRQYLTDFKKKKRDSVGDNVKNNQYSHNNQDNIKNNKNIKLDDINDTDLDEFLSNII